VSVTFAPLTPFQVQPMRSQPSSTPGRRVLALVVGALLLGAISVGVDAATARGATIGPQAVLRPPARFPVDFAGRRYRLHGQIPKGFAVVHRLVRMRVGERPQPLRFTCPRRLVALEPGLKDPSEIGFQVDDLSQYRHPARVFRLRVYPAPARFVKGDMAGGRAYVLCGPRSAAPKT
jgi:hypothetical protein